MLPLAAEALSSKYGIIAILIVLVILIAVAIMVLSHIIGPKRHGKIKDMTYESGVDPILDARRRFNVGFYLVAVLFLVFDVEIIFLYPWAVVFPGLVGKGEAATQAAGAGLAAAGYSSGFFLASIGIFFGLLAVGFVYEWRKGIFKWN